MAYLKSESGKSPEETLNQRKKIASEDIECYKVIEEYLSSTGKVQHRTFPLYCELDENAICGKVPQIPNSEEIVIRNGRIDGTICLNLGVINSYKKLEDAIAYMNSVFVGYSEMRPVIYKCIIPSGTEFYETFKTEVFLNATMECYASKSVMYIEPLLQRVSGVTTPYKKLTKQEKKPKKYGIVYDENDIDGETCFEQKS